MCRVARAWGYGLWEAQLHWNGPKDESWRNEAGQTTQGLACDRNHQCWPGEALGVSSRQQRLWAKGSKGEEGWGGIVIGLRADGGGPGAL